MCVFVCVSAYICLCSWIVESIYLCHSIDSIFLNEGEDNKYKKIERDRASESQWGFRLVIALSVVLYSYFSFSIKKEYFVFNFSDIFSFRVQKEDDEEYESKSDISTKAEVSFFYAVSWSNLLWIATESMGNKKNDGNKRFRFHVRRNSFLLNICNRSID